MNFTTPPPDAERLAATWAAIRPARCTLSLAEALRHPTWSIVLRMASTAHLQTPKHQRHVAALKAQAPDEPDLFTEAP
jgi:hypothetical protein